MDSHSTHNAGKSSSHCTGSAGMLYPPMSFNDASADSGKHKMGGLLPSDLESAPFVIGETWGPTQVIK